MSRMEQYEIARLRDLPIEQVAQSLGLEVRRHKALCPFHDDHHASLTFSLRHNLCRCFACMDRSLGTIDLTMRLMGCDFPSACRWLAQEGGITLTGPATHQPPPPRHAPRAPSWSKAREPAAEGSEHHTAFDAARYARHFEHPHLSPVACDWLFAQRRIDPRVARWCRLTSWCDRGGTHWLEVPYYDHQGQLTGLQWRNLSGSTPRFRFPQGARTLIYGLPILRLVRPGDCLYITEGASDCWAMLSSGHKAIAIPSATLLGRREREWLKSLGESLHVEWHMWPDQDVPGERLYLELKELLPGLVRHQLPPDCKDYGDYWARHLAPEARAPHAREAGK